MTKISPEYLKEHKKALDELRKNYKEGIEKLETLRKKEYRRLSKSFIPLCEVGQRIYSYRRYGRGKKQRYVLQYGTISNIILSLDGAGLEAHGRGPYEMGDFAGQWGPTIVEQPLWGDKDYWAYPDLDFRYYYNLERWQDGPKSQRLHGSEYPSNIRKQGDELPDQEKNSRLLFIVTKSE